MLHDKISWNDVEELVNDLERQIKKANKKYDFVIGINRGGLVPSVMLSHRLGATHGVHTVHSYDGTEKQRSVKADLYISMVGIMKSHSKILLVDDIADSGDSLVASMKAVKKIDPDVKNLDVGVLHYKTKSIFKPTFHGKKINDDLWIEYPWEKYD
jgi:hypoxanthine phosphoribosyltransferase